MPSLQLKYAALDVSYVVVATCSLGILIFFEFPEILRGLGQNTCGIDPASFMRMAIFGFFVLLSINAAVTFCLSIILSHRIVGPLFVFERVLRKAADGDYTERVTLRKLDEFGSVSDELNRVVDRLVQLEKECKSGKQG